MPWLEPASSRRSGRRRRDTVQLGLQRLEPKLSLPTAPTTTAVIASVSDDVGLFQGMVASDGSLYGVSFVSGTIVRWS